MPPDQQPPQPQLDTRALDEVFEKLFKNYKEWCKYLGREPNLRLPTLQGQVKQCKLLYMGLHLLIWGEAANLRFMPECLCYIYHHMALELYRIVSAMRPVTWKIMKPAYGGEEEAFLKKVVTPIYEVIQREALSGKRGKGKHSQWRNYDDLNEYFWSVACFRRLGWPMLAAADFFCRSVDQQQLANSGDNKRTKDGWVGKVNFVEIRSFWHIFRSFDRMWSFFILCLQAMIIVAWNGNSGDLSAIFDLKVIKKVSSIFITAAVLKLGQAVLDVILSWKAWRSMSLYVKIRYILKVVFALAWVVILLVTYIVDNLRGFPFILAVVVYLVPNMLAGSSFLFPSFRRFLERSNNRFIMVMMWWSQPRLYVGRGIHESTFSFIKYATFWVLLIVSKLAISYYLEIKPLVGPTKAVMSFHITTYQWPEFFPRARSNIGVVIALWAPIILVYFMDTQIWYAIFSTIFGGIYGGFLHIGEIRNLDMLRSRFQSLPGAFKTRLIPFEKREELKKVAAKFAQSWNTIITSFREEDLISNWEMDRLLVPYWTDHDFDLIQWPPFLLASKIPIAVNMAKDSNGKDRELKKRIETDYFMFSAVAECYISFRDIIKYLVRYEREKEVIKYIFSEVEEHIDAENLMEFFNLSALPSLYDLIVKLINFLIENKPEDREKVVILFQDMLQVFTRDITTEDQLPRLRDIIRGISGVPLDKQYQLFASDRAIEFPVSKKSEAWKEKIKRLYLLLTVKESAMDVPTNLEARRRLFFFSTSFFMDMPSAPKVRNMISFSVLTPYYDEVVLFPLEELHKRNDDEVSILFYLQKIFPDEWENFLERVKCLDEGELKKSVELEEELRLWASYRGQTLTKTVRGMMYYRKALELQAVLDIAEYEDVNGPIGLNEDQMEGKRSLTWTHCQALADMKFTYVVSCQQYGSQKRSGDARAKDILRLMTTYPSLRVAYIDEVESPCKTKNDYYSTLVKAAMPISNSSDPGQNLDQVIYRIKLPGPAILGEGKPENQNHAIIFTRGEALQTIDMNQDNYMEEALKMRNLLQEFLKKHDGLRYPTILGVREHIFTGSVSSLAWFMSNQEMSFVTIGQRLLAYPLKVRFHYGHPDVFDRLFHLTRGGVSKASKTINLSEDIFAGFNSTLREGNVTHHEYIQVGKGRDVGLNQISMFEAKIANGNGEQTLCRDLFRLGHCFDFFRMMSCYFTTIGFYFSTLITVLTVYVFLYGRLYLVLSGLEKGLSQEAAMRHNEPLQVALASQCIVPMGFLLTLPMVMEIGLERGFRTSLSDFILMQLQLAPVFFTFSLGTKTHYFGRTVLHGGAKYRPTGRGFVVFHVKFAENYRFYSRSHFVKGFELMILLVVYRIFGQSYRGAHAYILSTISIWFMVGTWLFAPFLFNPSGFEWQKIVDDWTDWNKWISNRGGIGEGPEKSWESWWEEEQEHLQHTGIPGTVAEIVLSLRFFIYQYGLVYHLSMTKNTKSIMVYGGSWLVILLIWFLMTMVSVAARWEFGARFPRRYRLIKALIFLAFALILVILPVLHIMTFQDIAICILGLIPTGWGLLQIAQALKSRVCKAGFWGEVRTLARNYEIVMGFMVFAPVAILAWFPFMSEIHTRILFNQAFSRGLQISRILGGHREDRSSRSYVTSRG